MPTVQPPGRKPIRPIRAPNAGNGGGSVQPSNGQSRNGKRQQSSEPTKDKSSMAKSALKFAFTPEIGRSMQGVKFAWDILINLIAQVYVMVNLIPADHPCTNLRHAGEYKLTDIIKIAYKSLKWDRSQVPQIVIFFAVLAFLFFIALSLVTLILSIGVNAAHAQTPTPNSSGTSANDVLNQIFNLQGAGIIPTAFGAMLRAYSNIVMVLAGIILLYHILHYVVESARHGQPGGKSFNHAWGPVRLVFALGLLIPLSSGLNSGQYITLYLAKWGSDMASSVYKQFSNQIGLGQGVTVSSIGVNTQKPLAQLFDLYLKADMENDKNPGSIILPNAMVPVTNKPNYYELDFTPSDSTKALGNQAGAGKIIFYNNPSATTPAEKILNSQWQYFSQNKDSIAQMARDVADHFNATGGDNPTYFTAINQAAFKDALGNLAKNYSTAIGQNYQQAITTENQSLADQMKNDTNSLGWISAPIWFQRLAVVNANMESAYEELPTVISNGNNMSDQLLGNSLDAAQVKDNPNVALTWFNNKLEQVFSGSSVLRIIGADNTGARLYKFFIIDSDNPFGSMVTLGHMVLAAATGLIGAWSTFALFIGVASSQVNLEFLGIGGGFKFEGLQVALDSITPIINAMIGLLFVNGYMLGILFPLIPVIRFIFGALGWIVMVLIAVMGMPLFALAHLKTGGEGWIGQLQVASAYNMIIGIIIRPTLIIIGFITGIITFNLVIKMGGYILISALSASSGSAQSLDSVGGVIDNVLATGISSPFNFITQILTLFLFSSFAVAVANSCFKLVDIIPSQAMTWMGTGPMSSPVEDGTDRVTSETQSFAGTFGQVQSQLLGYKAKNAASTAAEARQGKFSVSQDDQAATEAAAKDSGNKQLSGPGGAKPGGGSGPADSAAQSKQNPAIDIVKGNDTPSASSGSKSPGKGPGGSSDGGNAQPAVTGGTTISPGQNTGGPNGSSANGGPGGGPGGAAAGQQATGGSSGQGDMGSSDSGNDNDSAQSSGDTAKSQGTTAANMAAGTDNKGQQQPSEERGTPIEEKIINAAMSPISTARGLLGQDQGATAKVTSTRVGLAALAMNMVPGLGGMALAMKAGRANLRAANAARATGQTSSNMTTGDMGTSNALYPANLKSSYTTPGSPLFGKEPPLDAL